MGQSSLLIRLAAVASSLLLLAGFVGFRAGAFDWAMRSEEPPLPAPQIESVPATVQTDVMMGGSKSIVISTPNWAEQPPQTAPTILPGSKSDAPLIPVSPSPPSSAQRTIILPGSKSAPVFSPPAPPASQTAAPPK